MNYLELIRMASTSDQLSFLSMATTGVGKDDKIIAVFVGKETGPIAGMACDDVTTEQLESTYRYHRISKHMYDNMIQVSRDVMARSLANFFSNDILLSYNPKFVRRMISGLTPVPSDLPDVVDVCKVCQWVRSGQIFKTEVDASLGTMMLEMSEWNSSQTPGIKKTVTDLIPQYEEDLSKPSPESMIEALRCLCKFLETQPVRISQG